MKYLKLFENFKNYNYIEKNPDLNKGYLTCFHSVMKQKEFDWNSFKYGFKISSEGGKLHGSGIYAFLNFSDLYFHDYGKFSKAFIKIEITKNLNKFFISIPEIAERLLGEFNPKSQLINIMGENWCENNVEICNKILDENNIGENYARYFDEKIYGNTIKGSIFFENKLYLNDKQEPTPWVVIYDEKIAIPKSYSIDKGQTWEK